MDRGGYASSTIGGCNTSSYHGLLIGALDPPVKRIMALSNCLDMIIFDGKVYNLSTCEFSDKFAPADIASLKQFRKDTGVHLDYELSISESNFRLNLKKSIYLLRDQDTVAIVYDFTEIHVTYRIITPSACRTSGFSFDTKIQRNLCIQLQSEHGVSIRR